MLTNTERSFRNSSDGEKTSQNKTTYIFALVIVSILAIMLFIFIPRTTVDVKIEKECGDGFCNENCFDCPLDCECQQGVCYNDLKRCGKIPDPVKSIVQEEYGDGYIITESWIEDGNRVYRGSFSGIDFLIKNGELIKLENL